MLCSYSFQNMPEKVSVRTLLYGMPTTATVALPSAFQIPGGNCNLRPSSTLSFILTGGPTICGDGAYNINFKVTLLPSSIERSPGRSGVISNVGGPPHGLLSQPAAPNSSISGPTKSATSGATLLSSGPGTGSPVPAQSNDAGLQKKRDQTTPGAPAGGTHQSEIATNRGAASQILTNSDVVKMVQAGLADSVIVSSIRSSKKKFDFSPEGCRLLQRARVSAGILATMGDGGVRPCGDVTGNLPSAN